MCFGDVTVEAGRLLYLDRGTEMGMLLASAEIRYECANAKGEVIVWIRVLFVKNDIN